MRALIKLLILRIIIVCPKHKELLDLALTHVETKSCYSVICSNVKLHVTHCSCAFQMSYFTKTYLAGSFCLFLAELALVLFFFTHHTRL